MTVIILKSLIQTAIRVFKMSMDDSVMIHEDEVEEEVESVEKLKAQLEATKWDLNIQYSNARAECDQLKLEIIELKKKILLQKIIFGKEVLEAYKQELLGA